MGCRTPPPAPVGRDGRVRTIHSDGVAHGRFVRMGRARVSRPSRHCWVFPLVNAGAEVVPLVGTGWPGGTGLGTGECHVVAH